MGQSIAAQPSMTQEPAPPTGSPAQESPAGGSPEAKLAEIEAKLAEMAARLRKVEANVTAKIADEVDQQLADAATAPNPAPADMNPATEPPPGVTPQ